MTPLLTGAGRLRLLISLFVIFFVFAAEYAAIARVFLPAQIAALDPQSKVANLAVVTALTSVGIIIATPLSGALSDRLRSRWGRRTPFILGGALIGQVLILGMASASSVPMLAACWIASAFFLNCMEAPMTTLIADRFDTAHRGTASGFMGAGLTTGLTAGTAVAALLAGDPGLGYALFAASVLLTTILFVAVNREPSSRAMLVPPFDWQGFVRGFWVSPRAHPDFAWAFASRFFMFMGYTSVVAYTLYTLRDYVGLAPEAANHALALIFTIELVVGLIAGLGCGWLSDRWGMRKPFVFVASAAIAASFAVPVMLPNTIGMYVYAIILGIGYGAYYSVDMALMTDVLPRREHDASGRDLGILSVAITLPQIFGLSLAAAVLTAVDNDYRYLFACGAALVLASAFMVLPIRAVR